MRAFGIELVKKKRFRRRRWGLGFLQTCAASVPGQILNADRDRIPGIVRRALAGEVCGRGQQRERNEHQQRPPRIVERGREHEQRERDARAERDADDGCGSAELVVPVIWMWEPEN
jgi:hypothetical protein